jgi:hypothetical protein
MQNDDIIKITQRHVGRCLGQLEEAGAPKLHLEAVRREFWFLNDDIIKLVKESEYVNAEERQPN